MPHSFYEVEHTTDIQNSLLKFNDLQDFYARMVIVADEKRRSEFIGKLEYAAFNTLRENKRVAFLSYESLDKQYEQELLKQQMYLQLIMFQFVVLKTVEKWLCRFC